METPIYWEDDAVVAVVGDILYSTTLLSDNPTWWLIPLSKWVITPDISGLTPLIPLKSPGLFHPLTIRGMNHQVGTIGDSSDNL